MRALWGSVAAVVAVPAAFWLATLSTVPGSPMGPAPIAAAPPLQATMTPTAVAPTAVVPIRPVAARGASPRAAPAGAASLRVEPLLRLATPRERYQAFALLADCVHAIDFDRYLESLPVGERTSRLRQRYGDGAARIAAACGDLSARQVEQRIALAAGAADEGVPGAASAWIEEGPYGNRSALTQRPDDPLIVEWAERAIERVHAATRRADTEAISQYALLSLHLDLDDVARVRLLVDAAVQRRREERIERILQ